MDDPKIYIVIAAYMQNGDVKYLVINQNIRQDVNTMYDLIDHHKISGPHTFGNALAEAMQRNANSTDYLW